MQSIHLALVIVILLIFAALTYRMRLNNKFFHKYLHGLWEADDDFCDDAGIDGFLLYVGSDFTQTPNAYIIMLANGGVVMERKITMQIHGLSADSMAAYNKSNHRLKLTIHDDDADDDDLFRLDKYMPLKLQLDVDFTTGKMTWRQDDTIYARLYKNCLASHKSAPKKMQDDDDDDDDNIQNDAHAQNDDQRDEIIIEDDD